MTTHTFTIWLGSMVWNSHVQQFVRTAGFDYDGANIEPEDFNKEMAAAALQDDNTQGWVIRPEVLVSDGDDIYGFSIGAVVKPFSFVEGKLHGRTIIKLNPHFCVLSDGSYVEYNELIDLNEECDNG